MDLKDQVTSTKPSLFLILKNKKLIILFLIIGLLLLSGLSYYFINSSSRKAEIPKNAQYIEDEIVIKYKEGFAPGEEKHDSIKQQLKELGVISSQKVYESTEAPLDRYYKLQLKQGTNIEEIRDALNKLEAIGEAEPNYILQTRAAPNDTLYPRLWSLPKIQADKAWDITKGKNEVTVAIVDTGVDYNHEDLQGKVIKGRDFSTCAQVSLTPPITCLQQKLQDDDPLDDNGHGTHVAGIVAALSSNQKGITGVVWQGKILAVKVLDTGGGGSMTDVMQGIEYAINNGSNVINLSLGAPGNCSPMNDLFKKAAEKKIVIIAAAGNDNTELLNDVPGTCENVISVANTNQSDGKTDSSRWGSQIDIAAPGADIISLKSARCDSRVCVPDKIINTSYLSLSGTSMASPHVAGVAALIISANQQLTSQQVEACIKNGDEIQTDKPIGKRLNALKALEMCKDTSPSPKPTVLLSPTPSPSSSPSPSIVQGSSTCTVVLASKDESNPAYNVVKLNFSGVGGKEVILQMGQKGSAGTEPGNGFSTNGFFSSNFVQAMSTADQGKRVGQTPGGSGRMPQSGSFASDSVFYKLPESAVFQPTEFTMYEWEKKFKKNPTILDASTTLTDFVTGKATAWWYFIDSCDGTTLCSKNNVEVRIPKEKSAYFFCSVRKSPTVDLVCIGNPICSYNDGPDVGAKPDIACTAWKQSCSATDSVIYEPTIKNRSGDGGVNLKFFTPSP